MKATQDVFGLKVQYILEIWWHNYKKSWNELLTSLFSFITRVRGQCKYLRYLRDVIGWKLGHSGQYSPADLFKYGRIKYKKMQKNCRKICRTLSNSAFIFLLPKTWIHYSEDIKGRRRDEDIAKGDEEMKILHGLHFVSITHGLIILLFCIPKEVGLVSTFDLFDIGQYSPVLPSETVIIGLVFRC